MSKLIILRGNSGSGKTTAAKMLQEKFGPNTMLISHDMVRIQILHVWSWEGLSEHHTAADFEKRAEPGRCGRADIP